MLFRSGGQVLGAAGALSLAAIKSGAEYFGITQPEQVRTHAGEQPLPKDAHAGHAHGDSTTPAGKQTAGTAAPAFEQGYLESGMTGKVISIPGDDRDHGRRKHQGIDVAHQIGSDIKARGDGVIVKSEVQGGRINAGYGGTSGGIITVRYADGLTVKYLHTSDQFIKDESGRWVPNPEGGLRKPGETVKAGEIIGRSGIAGSVAHTHVETFMAQIGRAHV